MARVSARRVVLEVVGWVLVVVGIVALVAPGPGLLLLFAGLLVLSQENEWARKRVDPVRKKALQGASDSVQTWPRIIVSLLGVVWLVGLGIVWGIGTPVPDWWPVRDSWWLVGGWGTGATLIASGLFALGLIVYSYRRFRRTPYEHPDAESGTPADAPV